MSTQQKAPARASHAAPGRKQETRGENATKTRQSQFTAGRSLFECPLAGPYRVPDIRFTLEMKLAACLATGGTNGYPIQPHRIKNPAFRSLVAAGMICRRWCVKDLTECTDRLEGGASLALIATLERPVWGQADYLLLETIECLEQLQSAARGCGRTL